MKQTLGRWLPRWRASVGRHPRLWGLVMAGLLLASYLIVLRPAREWTTQHVAYPVFAAVDTPRAQTFTVAIPDRRPEAVFAIPEGAGEESRIVWAAPAGVIFLLPAMFLIAAFPLRRYWLWLLAYHVGLGATTLVFFALGLGWIPAAFDLHQFARTYVSEGVSLTVPLLLFLAGKAQQIREEDAASPAPAATS